MNDDTESYSLKPLMNTVTDDTQSAHFMHITCDLLSLEVWESCQAEIAMYYLVEPTKLYKHLHDALLGSRKIKAACLPNHDNVMTY